MPHLVQLANEHSDEDVAFVALLSERRTSTTDAFIAETGAGDYVATDESRTSRDAYDVRGVPTTVIIDETGRLMFRHLGFEEGMEEQFKQEVKTLLAWRTET